MIVAEQKPVKEILALIENCSKIMVVGCGGCVTVCLSGGEKETEILASAIKIKRETEGRPVETVTATLTRQCDPEYVEQLAGKIKDVDVVVSLGCGVGVQYLAERYKDKWVIPGQNTKFAGGAVQHGEWEERCGLCGDCILHLTGGICPVIRCAKSIMNGPCGGSQYGKCEINKEQDCAWQLIYDKMKALGRLEEMMKYLPAKDWSKARDGGPRKVVREDVIIE